MESKQNGATVPEKQSETVAFRKHVPHSISIAYGHEGTRVDVSFFPPLSQLPLRKIVDPASDFKFQQSDKWRRPRT